MNVDVSITRNKPQSKKKKRQFKYLDLTHREPKILYNMYTNRFDNSWVSSFGGVFFIFGHKLNTCSGLFLSFTDTWL